MEAWQVWIERRHVATVELAAFKTDHMAASRFRRHITDVAGTQDVELVLDAHAKGTLI